jgi:hypothetical protein
MQMRRWDRFEPWHCDPAVTISKWPKSVSGRSSAVILLNMSNENAGSNHVHIILRNRPDVVATWSVEDVARRWLRLCPVRKTGHGAE